MDRILGRVTCAVMSALTLSGSALATTSDVRGLLLRTLDEPGGRVSEYLEGALARRVQGALRTDRPVLAEVSTIKSYEEPGCKQLALRLSVPGHVMPTKDGEMAKAPAVEYHLNICRNGLPPASMVDIGALSAMSAKRSELESAVARVRTGGAVAPDVGSNGRSTGSR